MTISEIDTVSRRLLQPLYAVGRPTSRTIEVTNRRCGTVEERVLRDGYHIFPNETALSYSSVTSI